MNRIPHHLSTMQSRYVLWLLPQPKQSLDLEGKKLIVNLGIPFQVSNRIESLIRNKRFNKCFKFCQKKPHNFFNFIQVLQYLHLMNALFYVNNSLTCNISKKGIFLYKSQKIFLFFMGDESPNAHESKSMIGFIPSAQQLTLQSSKVQNCQH